MEGLNTRYRSQLDDAYFLLNFAGVQITNTVLELTSNELTEDSGAQDVQLSSVTSTAGPGSSTVPPIDDNFEIELFGNSMDDASGPRVARSVVESLLPQAVMPGTLTSMTESKQRIDSKLT